MQTLSYEIQELVTLTGVQRRNIYFYVQQGLLPLLRRKGLKLDQMREQMSAMSSAEMRALLQGEEGQPPAPPPKAQPRQHSIPAGQPCTRYDLPGGMTLLVPGDLAPRHLDLLEEVLAAAARGSQ